jgi:hypothetical protein
MTGPPLATSSRYRAVAALVRPSFFAFHGSKVLLFKSLAREEPINMYNMYCSGFDFSSFVCSYSGKSEPPCVHDNLFNPEKDIKVRHDEILDIQTVIHVNSPCSRTVKKWIKIATDTSRLAQTHQGSHRHIKAFTDT